MAFKMPGQQDDEELQRLLSPFGGGGGFGGPPGFSGGSTSWETNPSGFTGAAAPFDTIPPKPPVPQIPGLTLSGPELATLTAQGRYAPQYVPSGLQNVLGANPPTSATLERPFADPFSAYVGGTMLQRQGQGLTQPEIGLYNQYVGSVVNPTGSPYGSPQYGGSVAITPGVARSLGLRGAPESATFQEPFDIFNQASADPTAGAAAFGSQLRSQYPELVNRPRQGFLGGAGGFLGALGPLAGIASLLFPPAAPFLAPLGIVSSALGSANQFSRGNMLGGALGAASIPLSVAGWGGFNNTAEGLAGALAAEEGGAAGITPAFEELGRAGATAGAGGFLQQATSPAALAQRALGAASDVFGGGQAQPMTQGPGGFAGQAAGFGAPQTGGVPAATGGGGQTGASRAAGATGPMDQPGTRQPQTPEELERFLQGTALSRFQQGQPIAPFGTWR